jgi:hypothetical protein
LNRGGQVAGSFVAVLAVYLLYWLLAVPLIEPELESMTVEPATPAQLAAAGDRVGSRQRELSRYFPEGAWERDKPAIIESGQTWLLFKAYEPVNGKLEVKPCTVMFFPKPAAGEAADAVVPVIMQTEKGAEIEFDEPIVLKTVDFGKRKLMSARLPGAIRIHRRASRPGMHDDLEITLRDAEMRQGRIVSPHAVNFRFGRSHGSGRDLEIQLATADGSESTNSADVSSVRLLQLKQDVRMFLDVGSNPAASGMAAMPNKEQPPIEITCSGIFQFLVQELAASFHNNVNVVRPNIPGESDQLNCELLTALFERGTQPSTPSPGSNDAAGQPLSALRVRLIEARGAPVTLRSPQRGIYARCAGMDYLPGATPEASTLVAMGPGVMQGHLSTDTAAKYDASWNGEFRLEPEGRGSRAALRGTVNVRYAQMGTVTADEILAWMTPVAASSAHAGSASPTARFQLERILARVVPDKGASQPRVVVIDSPQLHGTTSHLEAFVERSQTLASGGAPMDSGPAPPATRRPRTAQNPAERFRVQGRQMLLKLVPDGQQLALANVTIEHQAQLEQVAMALPHERPLVVRGDKLFVAGADREDTRVTVSGKPGYIEAGGMTLSGRTIEMEKHSRRLWIDGPGRMTMPLDQDLDGKALAAPQVVAVNWQGGMNFQSDTVIFQKRVLAQSESQMLETEKLEGVLTRPIDFEKRSDAAPGRPEDRPQLARLRCYGPVRLKSRQFDPQGKQISRSLVDASDLSIDRSTGDMHARGPGAVTHVAFGTNDALKSRAASPGRASVQPANQAAGLTHLNVVFQDTIQGNLQRREITFGDTTKTVYGPVAHWDAKLNADSPGGLGPEGMMLEARKLTVREMSRPGAAKRGWFELDAQGNIVAEGSGYTARGDRLTYSEEKDQIVLRGDGYSPAEIFQDQPGGGQRRETAANELTYWPTLQMVRVGGIKAIGLDAPKPPKKPGDK